MQRQVQEPPPDHPLPIGIYQGLVVSAEDKITKAGDDMVELQIDCNIDHPNKRVWEYLVFMPKCLRLTNQRLAAFGISPGMNWNTEDLLNKWVTVTVKSHREYNGKVSPEFDISPPQGQPQAQQGRAAHGGPQMPPQGAAASGQAQPGFGTGPGIPMDPPHDRPVGPTYPVNQPEHQRPAHEAGGAPAEYGIPHGAPPQQQQQPQQQPPQQAPPQQGQPALGGHPPQQQPPAEQQHDTGGEAKPPF